MAEVDRKATVEKILKEFSNIAWDRYTETINEHGEEIWQFYGWIERDTDSYKDFFLLSLNWATGKFNSLTSSPNQAIDAMAKRIIKSEVKKCKRIEDNFDVPDSIKLGEKNV